jgi:two-component system chemotaxis response regulator CheY
MTINVLVVDDSSVMRSMLIRTLRLSNLPLNEVHEAGNGVEALERLAAHQIDVALIDINMPVMNGERLIHAMQADPLLAAVQAIVVSTEGSAPRVDALKALGVRFVHKPFTPQEIRTTMLSVLGVTDA